MDWLQKESDEDEVLKALLLLFLLSLLGVPRRVVIEHERREATRTVMKIRRAAVHWQRIGPISYDETLVNRCLFPRVR